MPNLNKRAFLQSIASILFCLIITTAIAAAQSASENCKPAAVIPVTGSEPPARISIDPPLPGPLASRGVLIIQFCAQNLHLAAVFGPGALAVSHRSRFLHKRGARRPDALNPDDWVMDAYAFSIPASRAFMSRLFMNATTNIPYYPKWNAYLRNRQPKSLIVWGRNDLSFRQRLRKSSSRLCRRRSCAISTEAISFSTSMPTKSPTRRLRA